MRSFANIPTLVVLCNLFSCATVLEAPAVNAPIQTTHPLMPGIRSAEIAKADWPRTLHDKQLTGFSPLTLGMDETPEIWQTIDVGGTFGWAETVARADGSSALLVDDGRLTLYDFGDGHIVWRAEASGSLVHFGDIRGAGRFEGLFTSGNEMFLVDGATGEVTWRHAYDPPHVHLRARVADVLPDEPGLEVAVFEQYGDSGRLLAFPAEGAPREVWRRVVITNDEWPVRADHGCDVEFDFSNPDRPLIWYVRHHRCQSFDARTGEETGRLLYELGGGIRRNYGPWRIATGADGLRYIVVVSEMVQTHVHAIRMHPDGTPELAWERYYGEVYVVPGVATKLIAVADVDGDGADEVVYNARDPENDFRAFVRVRDVATGEVKHVLADHWCSGHAPDVGPARRHVFYVHPAPNGATPEQGPLALVAFTPDGVDTLRSFAFARPWGVTTTPGASGNDLLVRTIDGSEPGLLRLAGDDLRTLERRSDGSLLNSPIAALASSDDEPRAATSTKLCTWSGDAIRDLDLAGGPAPTLSAADLDGDGSAELVAHVPSDEFRVWSLGDSEAREALSGQFLGETSRYSPLLYDVDGDGQLEIIVPGSTKRGELAVRATRADGELLWESILPHSTTDDGGKAVAWNAGEFLRAPDGARAGVAITVYSTRRTMEGTFMLDGATGEVLWYRDLYRDGGNIRGYRPVGIPGAFDWDGDGAEEIAWDMYSYMAFLRGDGEFSAIFGGPNVNSDDPVPAILLYDGFTPIYRDADAERPHWFVHHGHGRFGLVGPDPREGIWWEDHGYDTPDRIGFIDVDGDGVMEVGYAIRNSTTFLCRDLWTGDVKWEIELPSAPSGPVITADVDGDGRGEFLVDRWCIGTNADGVGEVRWGSPVAFGWAVIADFDGDGVGEIACPGQGRITVLKGR